MEDLTETSTLAEIVAARPGAERVLEPLRLDYCCGGDRTLAESCASLSLDPDEVLASLAALAQEPTPDWLEMAPGELVDHIEGTHHVYLHAELPRLSVLAAKVLGVHGDRHPELAGVVEAYEAVRADIEPHLMKEERILFPRIRELAAGGSPSSGFHCGTLQGPVSVMLAEHDVTGDLLAELSARTGGHRPPADGCASYQALYEGFAHLEADTHLHIHKENHALFPAVLELEAALATAS